MRPQLQQQAISRHAGGFIVKPAPEVREHPESGWQRAMGNPAGQSRWQRRTEKAEGGLTSVASGHWAHDFSRIPIHSPDAELMQSSLTVNQPGDAYEREADRVSEHVMRLPESQLPSKGAGSGNAVSKGECAEYPKQRWQRRSAALQPARQAGAVAPPMVQEMLHSGGRPLDVPTRAIMERRFGHDFSQVRVHDGARAAESAREVNALAYTLGQDIVFGGGHYSPGTSAGQRLLAHELAHTVQQREVQQPKVAMRQAAGGSDRKLQVLEPRPEDPQRLVDAATKLQRYAGFLYSSLAGKTTPQNPLTSVFYKDVSKIDGEVGEWLGQALAGVQNGKLAAQPYADIIYGLKSAKTRLDNIVIQAGLAAPPKGGSVLSEFVDPYGERVDLTEVNRLMLMLGKGVIPGTPVTYGSNELLKEK